MTTLPTEFKKGGFDYRQVYRDDLVAIYEQSSEGQVIAFEVCEIIVAPAGEVFGKMLEEREKLPSTEQWGSKAFTVRTKEDADKKADEIRQRIMANRKQPIID